MKICIWPDGFWCEHDDLERCQPGRSDDFKVVDHPGLDELDDVEINFLIAAHLSCDPQMHWPGASSDPILPHNPGVADVGTIHITKTDAEFLDQSCVPRQIGKYEYGYAVRTCPKTNVEHTEQLRQHGMSEAYIHIVNLAYDQGCHYLIIDRDGATIPGLEKFEW